MSKKTPIINILTYGLPFKLSNQIYNEFDSRWREALYMINEVPRYKELKNFEKTVELLLAISIFHKRVVSNLDGAVKFFGTVTKNSNADSISIGGYDLTFEEKNKLMGLLINYRNLLEKYGLSDAHMEYYRTKDFLIKLLNLKSELEDD